MSDFEIAALFAFLVVFMSLWGGRISRVVPSIGLSLLVTIFLVFLYASPNVIYTALRVDLARGYLEGAKAEQLTLAKSVLQLSNSSARQTASSTEDLLRLLESKDVASIGPKVLAYAASATNAPYSEAERLADIAEVVRASRQAQKERKARYDKLRALVVENTKPRSAIHWCIWMTQDFTLAKKFELPEWPESIPTSTD